MRPCVECYNLYINKAFIKDFNYCEIILKNFSANIIVFKQILSLIYANDPNIISKLQFYGMDKYLDPAIIKGIYFMIVN